MPADLVIGAEVPMTRPIVLGILFASLAFGQDAVLEKKAGLIHLQSADALATVLRFAAELTSATPDNAARAITLRGTPEQIAFAEWLLSQLDRTDVASGGRPEYKAPGKADDLTRIFPVVHATGNRELAELGTVLRSVFEIRKLFTVSETRSVVVRGTAAQMAGVEWLLPKIDRPASTIGDKRDDHERFKDIGSPEPDNIVAVFHLANTATEQKHQEAVTKIRTVTKARRGFMYLATRIFVIRGAEEQIDQTASMVAEIDSATVR
jgi:hypothetical protein